MGRDAHLLRLAYSSRLVTPSNRRQGRSAFEPPQDETTSWHGSLQPGLSGAYQQQYDARGHPVNQASRDHGRAMRAAQNDCLAAVGVVLKKEKLARLHAANQYSRLEQEQSLFWIRLWGFAGYSVEAAALRCVYGIRDRIMAYPSAPEVGFPALLLGQYYQVGLRSMCLAGLPSFIAAQASFEIIAALNVAERLTRLSMAISTSRSVRRMSSAVAALVEYCWPDLLDIFTLPLQAHAYLQALGLLYPGYALPPLRSFNPLSPASPLAVSSPSLSTISSLSGVLSSTAVMLWTFEKLRRTLMTYLFESMPSVLQIVKIDMSSFSAGYQGEVIPYGWPSPQGEPDLESPAITPNAGPASDTRNAQPRSGPAPTPRPETNPDIVVTARTSSVDRTQGSLLITLEVQNADNTERNGAHAGYAVQEELSGADDDAQERRLLNEDRASGNRFPVTDVAYLCESLNSHLTRLVGNTIMLPLRMLLLQRMLLSFSPATYSWHVPSQSILWYPKTGREMYTLGGRLLICCGLECATRMALWLGEVAIVIWQRRRTARLMRNDDGNIESDSSEVHT